jgi:OmcA/MtrC family decaheme c-type cytochrome
MGHILSFNRSLIFAIVLLSAGMAAGADESTVFSPREKAFYADAAQVAFIRPGLLITINSATIAADGTITTNFTLADPKGVGLDNTGVLTPGAVSTSFVAAVLPNSLTNAYTSYTTRVSVGGPGAVLASTVQAGADTGGKLTSLGDGKYQYVFATKAPSGYDRTATHTIGIYGNRNLTEFNLGTNYASATFNFVPNGSAVVNTHDIVKTATCNNCHDQLAFHGGSRRGIELCIMCHTAQTTNAGTGNTVDFKVFLHKVHMGSQLPSVIAGKPYQIISARGTTSDYSTVVFPSDPRRCESCHAQNVKATQATAYLTNPSRAACGSCHDDVNFATGDKHAGGPQVSDNLCSTCHIPQGEIDFDASIKGAHVIPTESAMLSGIAVELTKVTGGAAGGKPTVTFTLKDGSGVPLPLSKLSSISLVMAGSTSDYGYTSFGSDVTTPGYVSESVLTAAKCGNDGVCLYTFTHAIPANATGTYTIGVEARRVEVLLPGTTKQTSVTYGAKNKVINFAVTGSTITPRRDVVATSNCNLCHTALSLHGGQRNQTEYCVLCHNPSNTDIARRPTATVVADRALPPQGINFNLLVHRIHTGEHLTEEGRPYVVVGFGGSHNDFSEVRYPAMALNGSVGDTRNCSNCHINGSEQILPEGKNLVRDPQGPLNPIGPIASACTGCHVKISTASHALANTTTLGESCATCHNSTSAFSVGSVHAQ